MDSSNNTLVVSLDLMQDVVADMTRDEMDVMEEAMQLLDLESGVPKLEYDLMKRRFQLASVNHQKRSGGGFFGNVDDKVDMLLQRYALIYQRLMRQEHFKPKLVSANAHVDAGDVVKITPIEGLLGSSGVKILLGIIVQVEEGVYYLEDPTAQIQIDLTMGEFLSDGFITEHSICLVEGEMVDGILVVKRIGQPIYESRKDAINAIGLQNSDFFGAIPTLSELGKLRKEEEKH